VCSLDQHHHFLTPVEHNHITSEDFNTTWSKADITQRLEPSAKA